MESYFFTSFFGKYKQHAMKLYRDKKTNHVEIRAFCDSKHKKFYSYPGGATCKNCLRKLKKQ
jgi:hypothetical protein